jgi:hypothetical protein
MTMLMEMPGTAMMAGLLSFDIALGSILVVALAVAFAIGLVTEVVAPKLRDLGASPRGNGRRPRRLASATTRL